MKHIDMLFKQRGKLAGLLVALVLAAVWFPALLGATPLAAPFLFGTLNDDSQATGAADITEAVLVAGIDLSLVTGHVAYTCTISAARIVGAPTGAAKNTKLTLIFKQSTAAGTGKGRHNITWNAVFKGVVGWSNANNGPGGNNIGKGSVTAITFITPDGTNFYPVGCQASWNS